MIAIKIKHKTTQSVLWKDEADNLCVSVENAIKEGANLRGAYLRGANLRGAYLRGANLEGAYLEGANLEGANLRGANLRGAYLVEANLEGANLEGANLEGAYLEGANLEGAYLEGANLRGAYLVEANLEGANLRGANLEGANLRGAYLPTGEKWEDYRTQVVPALLNGSPEWVEKITNSWQNHSWDNCPLATRYQTNSLRGLPILLRPRGEQFIQFFDAGLLDTLPEELGWTKKSA